MGAPTAGQVVLASFPFTDLSRNKLRPAVVLAGVSQSDSIVCQITSNPSGDPRSFELNQAAFAAGSLHHTSYVRPAKIFTAHDSLIASVVGWLTPAALEEIRKAVIAAICEA